MEWGSGVPGLLLAILLPAPFAYCLGAVVPDGRERTVGLIFLAAGMLTAAVLYVLSGSLVLADLAAIVLCAILAHARFMGAVKAPTEVGRPRRAQGQVPPPEGDDALRAGLQGVGEILQAADQLGELRHKRRLRRLERLRAEREAAKVVPLPAPAPSRERYIRVGAKRDPIRLLPRPKDPQEPSS